MSDEVKTPNLDELLDDLEETAAIDCAIKEWIKTRVSKDIAELVRMYTVEFDSRKSAQDVIATLRAKMATMVCGNCWGHGYTREDCACGCAKREPCPVCQPKEGT